MALKVENGETSELDVLQPEKKIGGLTVSPFKFGQLGTALRVLAPLSVSLDPSAADMGLSAINLPAIAYAVTDNDCMGIYELVALATNQPIEIIQDLTVEEGTTLLAEVYKTAIAPALQEIVKKLPLKKVGKAKGESKTTGQA
jgi:hypothetical protein